MSIDVIATASAEERQLAVEFAAAVLEEAAPDEVAALDDLSAEFFADPQRALQRDDRDEEFAFGVGLELLAPLRPRGRRPAGAVARRPGGRRGEGGAHADGG
jgi:hypothetical protein